MASPSAARKPQRLDPLRLVVLWSVAAACTLLVAATVVALAWGWRQWVGSNVLLAYIEAGAIIALISVAMSLPMAIRQESFLYRTLSKAAVITLAVLMGIFVATGQVFASPLFHFPTITIGHLLAVFLLLLVVGLLVQHIASANSDTHCRDDTSTAVVMSVFVLIVICGAVALPSTEPVYRLWGALVWGGFGHDDALSLMCLAAYLLCLGMRGPGEPNERIEQSLLLTVLISGYLYGLRGEEALTAVLPILVVVSALRAACSCFAGVADESSPVHTQSRLSVAVLYFGAICVVALVTLTVARLSEALALLLIGSVISVGLFLGRSSLSHVLLDMASALGRVAWITIVAAGAYLTLGVANLAKPLATASTGWSHGSVSALVIVIALIATRWTTSAAALVIVFPLTAPVANGAGLSLFQSAIITALSVWATAVLWPAIQRQSVSTGKFVAALGALLAVPLVVWSPMTVEWLPRQLRFW